MAGTSTNRIGSTASCDTETPTSIEDYFRVAAIEGGHDKDENRVEQLTINCSYMKNAVEWRVRAAETITHPRENTI
jgi:hypothetical protein